MFLRFTIAKSVVPSTEKSGFRRNDCYFYNLISEINLKEYPSHSLGIFGEKIKGVVFHATFLQNLQQLIRFQP
jgi:hypothetical protein